MKTWRLSALLVLAACGSGATKDNPCPMGICTNGSGDDGGSSGGGGSGGGGSSGAGCTPAWQCTPWAKQQDGTYTRTCTDQDKCGTTSGKPNEGPVSLPSLDVNYYRCNVEPIFDRSCAFMNCHGTEVGRTLKIYARGRLRMTENVPPPANYSCPDKAATVPLQMGTGTVMCEGWFPHSQDEWQSNYDDARSFMVGLDASTVDQSDLLAQPVYGGKAHAGVHLFKQTDPDYQTIKSWLTGATLASCDPTPN